MKKIMFNDRYGLTSAVLEGKKTQTRRVISNHVVEEYEQMFDPTLVDAARYGYGEIVAVAQSYKDAGYECFPYHDMDEYFYLKRDGILMEDISISPKGCTNKMFVKPELMPHQIRITNVRIERLQYISDEDCMKEGIRYIDDIERYYFECIDREEGFYFRSPREAYAA